MKTQTKIEPLQTVNLNDQEPREHRNKVFITWVKQKQIKTKTQKQKRKKRREKWYLQVLVDNNKRKTLWF